MFLAVVLMHNLVAYGNEYQTISLYTKRKLEMRDIRSYQRMLRMLWTEHVSNKKALRKIGTRILYLQSERNS